MVGILHACTNSVYRALSPPGLGRRLYVDVPWDRNWLQMVYNIWTQAVFAPKPSWLARILDLLEGSYDWRTIDLIFICISRSVLWARSNKWQTEWNFVWPHHTNAQKMAVSRLLFCALFSIGVHTCGCTYCMGCTLGYQWIQNTLEMVSISTVA